MKNGNERQTGAQFMLNDPLSFKFYCNFILEYSYKTSEAKLQTGGVGDGKDQTDEARVLFSGLCLDLICRTFLHLRLLAPLLHTLEIIGGI
jgi:hypothetical protein